MKKNLLIMGVYFSLTFAICLVISLVEKNVPELLPGKSGSYVFVRGLLYFLNILPAVVCSGFLISESINFATVSEKAKLKFSPAIISQFKQIMIASICMVLVLTLSKEIFIPVLSARQRSAQEAPRRVSEYVILGQGQYLKGNYELAHEYARTALTIEPRNEQALRLIDETEAVLQRMVERPQKAPVDRSRELQWEELAGETVTTLIEKSKAASEKEDWFGAHYYAEMATKISTFRDVNVGEAKLLASAAWNRLSIPDVMATSEEQQLYLDKKDAYTILMAGDNLDAYYTFLDIKNASQLGASDLDVKRYLGIAESRLMRECFFSEETVNMKRFETFRNVYFTICHDSGARDVIFIEGITPVQETGDRLTYLRGFNMYSYDENGDLLRRVKTPYAKMKVTALSTFSFQAKENFGIKDSFKEVPTLLLKSIGKENRDLVDGPEYWFSDKLDAADRLEQNFLVLPISFENYNLACEAAMGADKMSLPSLLKINSHAGEFGFSEEIYGVALVRRMLYPLIMLIILILLASIAWNYRLKSGQLFKFSWVFLLPLCAVIFYFLFEILFFIADLVYYALIGFSGNLVLLLTLAGGGALLVWFCANFLNRTGD